MAVDPVLIPHERSYYTYKCQVCGFECRSKHIGTSDVPITKTGSYGTNATPTSEEFADEMYETTTISFTAETATDPAYLTDSEQRFGDKLFKGGMPIRIETTSGTNDGDYTIAAGGVSREKILLSDSDSLTTETAATAGTVTISQVNYQPSVTSGCPLCGSLNSR
jgi:hypothetical protein